MTTARAPSPHHWVKPAVERWRARADITGILAPWFAARRVEDFAKAFDEGGVTWSVFRSFSEALAEDEQRPAVPDHGEGPCHRAVLLRELRPAHAGKIAIDFSF